MGKKDKKSKKKGGGGLDGYDSLEGSSDGESASLTSEASDALTDDYVVAPGISDAAGAGFGGAAVGASPGAGGAGGAGAGSGDGAQAGPSLHAGWFECRGILMDPKKKASAKKWVRLYVTVTPGWVTFGTSLRAADMVAQLPLNFAEATLVEDKKHSRSFVGDTVRLQNSKKQWKDLLVSTPVSTEREAFLAAIVRSGELSSPVIFGVPLDIVLAKGGIGTEYRVPPVLEDCCGYLTRCALAEEGLFRLSGSSADVEALKDRFNAGAHVDLAEIQDPHMVSTVIKQFVRELAEPLLSFELYDEFIALGHVLDGGGEITDEQLASILVKLPEANWASVDFLCTFLVSVAAHAATNKMTFSNLATVFGPNILRAREENLADIKAIISVSDYLFEHFPRIRELRPTATPSAGPVARPAGGTGVLPTGPAAAAATSAATPPAAVAGTQMTAPVATRAGGLVAPKQMVAGLMAGRPGGPKAVGGMMPKRGMMMGPKRGVVPGPKRGMPAPKRGMVVTAKAPSAVRSAGDLGQVRLRSRTDFGPQQVQASPPQARSMEHLDVAGTLPPAPQPHQPAAVTAPPPVVAVAAVPPPPEDDEPGAIPEVIDTPHGAGNDAAAAVAPPPPVAEAGGDVSEAISLPPPPAADAIAAEFGAPPPPVVAPDVGAAVAAAAAVTPLPAAAPTAPLDRRGKLQRIAELQAANAALAARIAQLTSV